MRSVMGRRLAAVILLGTLAGASVWLGRPMTARGLEWAESFSSVASFVLAAAAVLVPFAGRTVGWLRGEPPLATIDVTQAKSDLASALERQWAEEERLRRINDPHPLPVTWEVVRGDPPDSDDVLDLYTALPEGRLVILGVAGAGKSVMAVRLVRGLLGLRHDGDPVPVIVPAVTWPADADLPEWVSRELAASHPGLAARIRTAVGETITLAQALVRGGHVLPIIDGLDELPEARRTQAVAAINAYGSDAPIVVTARPEEYAQAIDAVGRDIAHATVIRLRPLRSADVTGYLDEATGAPADRWRPVFDRLDDEPDGALARALSTPLMVWLARAVYEARDSDPGELTRLTGQAEIETHLLEAFVPAVYGRRPPGPGRTGFACTPAQAARWLRFLAHDLQRKGTPDVAWWRLSAARTWLGDVASGLRGILRMAAALTLAVWALTRHGDLAAGRYVEGSRLRDLLLDGPLGQGLRAAADPVLDLVPATVREIPGDLLRTASGYGADFAALFSSVGPWAYALIVPVGIVTIMLFELVITVIRSVLERTARARSRAPKEAAEAVPSGLRFRPREGLSRAWNGTTALILLPLGVVVFMRPAESAAMIRGFASDPSRLFEHSEVLGPLLVLFLVVAARWVVLPSAAPVDVSASAASPRELLRLDRRTEIVSALLWKSTWITLLALYAAAEVAIAYGVYAAFSTVLRYVWGDERSGAWLRYKDARTTFAIAGRLPWRTMAFLADAHRRGVFRQVGAVYQFRHVRLQRQLADEHTSWADHHWAPLADAAAIRLDRAVPRLTTGARSGRR